MFLEQLFRISFKKHEKNFNRAKYYQYEIIQLTGNSGMRSRLHNCEIINAYLRRSSSFEWFTNLCDEAISTIKIMQKHTILPRDLSRINLILALKKAVEEKCKNFTLVYFRKNILKF